MTEKGFLKVMNLSFQGIIKNFLSRWKGEYEDDSSEQGGRRRKHPHRETRTTVGVLHLTLERGWWAIFPPPQLEGQCVLVDADATSPELPWLGE